MRKIHSLLLAMVIVMTSCSENQVEPSESITSSKTPKVSSNNGVLHFSTPDAVFETYELFNTMTEDERKAWEKNLGFESLNSVIDKVMDKLNSAQTKAEYENILERNKHLVELRNNSVERKIPFGYYALIANRNGVYFVQGAAYKISEKSLTVVADGNLNKLEKAASLKTTDKEKGIITIPLESKVLETTN
jgi:hypothetical protein